MNEPTIPFEDGDAYERGMGAWSRLAGTEFLDWLAPKAGLSWVDIGCGNGAFTDLVVQRCAPAETQGVDPSAEQIAYARKRPGTPGTTYLRGDAMALPFEDARFDMAVMALVIFFVPDPAKSVAEMVRVVRPGGLVTTYAWDLPNGGTPYALVRAEQIARGIQAPAPPSPAVSRMETLRQTWEAAGLRDLETHAITVERRFADFEEYWGPFEAMGSMRQMFSAMSAGDVAAFKAAVRDRLAVDEAGRLICTGRANAIQGRVPT